MSDPLAGLCSDMGRRIEVLTKERDSLLALLKNTRSDIIAVCCDHDGNVCFNGSDGDRKVMQDALDAIDAARPRCGPAPRGNEVMKVVLSDTEWYPVHVWYDYAEENGGWLPEDATEVDDATLARWQAVFDAFDAVQKEIEARMWKKP